MAKAPAFQFYANDFIGATITWDAIACGMYIRLLCTQWVNGSIPDDQRRIAKAAGVDLAELQREWHLLEPKFPLDAEGTRKNLRLEEVRQRQSDVSNARKEAANTRWNSNANASAKSVQRKVKEKVKDKEEDSKEGNERATLVTTRLDYEGFRERCLKVHKEVKLLSDAEAKAFFDYWTEGHPETKSRYATMDKFDIAKRMGTWKRNNFAAKPEVPAISPTAKPWMQ
jgi:uncharacterized protein YdaU (DUF1376 family)